ncbi:MAG: AbrB/MazE/SpoVT family DNA-binding domain-containing protein [Methylophilaceae bacterium]|nr:AbrB/MazE/SpoVT family DNA-binding domain-containing protein [Methylophilaceae bacterium]
MTMARVFQSGNSQALRLPKEFRFKSKEVEIFQRGDEVVLREKRYTPADALEIFASLGADLFAGDFLQEDREDTPPQERENL